MISTDGMTPLSCIDEVDDDPIECRELAELGQEAQAYLDVHWWCEEVLEGYFDRGFSKFGVFYFRFRVREGSSVDSEMWIVAGDCPPAYLDTYYCRNGAEAVDAYVYLMREWGEAAIVGKPVGEFFPVMARGSFRLLEPTPEFGTMLLSRMNYVEEHLLSEWRDEIGEPPPELE